MKRNNNAVLIELGGSHAECLHTQIHYLSQQGYNVHLICDHFVWSQIEEKNRLAGVQLHSMKRGGRGMARIVRIFRIHYYLRHHKVRFVVINTTEITAIRDIFLIPMPRRINFTGMVHNGKKLSSGRSLNLIVGRRVKKFFVLGQYIKNKYQPRTRFKLEVFYPLWFPKFEDVNIPKAPNELWITVPGGVSERRDYTGLLQRLQTQALHPNIKLILLGHFDKAQDPDLNALLLATNLLNTQIITFPGFIDNPTFHSFVRRSDLIMPLMYANNNEQINFYGDNRISGSFNLAFAYKIPMLVEKSIAAFDDIKHCSFFYDAATIISTINNLADRRADIQALQNQMACNPQLSTDYQMQKYLAFVEMRDTGQNG
jgi:hypothetical protein